MAFNQGFWRAKRKQEPFLSLPWTIKEGFYGGGAGSGKSDVLLVYGIVHKLHENPRFKQVFMRRTFPELRNEIVPRSREIYSKFGATLNRSEMCWTFPRLDQYGGQGLSNAGAMIFLGHCEDENDVHKYDSMEINLFTPDELTSITEYIYLYIGFTRVRTSDSALPAIIRAAGMPGGIGHCLNEGEVLTLNGWKDIKEINVGEKVYEVNPETFELEESIVEQYYKHEYDGLIWKAHTTNLDISCTPEHRILRLLGKKGRDNNYTLTPASELPNQANICRSAKFYGSNEQYFKIPDFDGRKTKLNQPAIIPYDLYAEFMGWFLSEGFTINRDKSFSITQTKLSNCPIIENILNRCGFSYKYNSNSYIISSPSWWSYLKQFGKSRDKFIPRELLNSSNVSLRYLFNSLMDGGGYWTSYLKSGCYYTISKKLADDVSELAFKIGYSCKLSSKQRENRKDKNYQLAFTSQFTSEIIRDTKRKSNISEEFYNGLVYDIGVPKYHTFVTRQNGSIWISGNSWVKRRFVDPYKDGGKLIIGKGGNKRIYIFATLADNDAIDPAYAQSLEALPEAEKRAKKYGDWDAYKGQVFEEFRELQYPDEPDNAVHVISPFEIPDWWPKIVVIDWGYAAMNYISYSAISPNKRIYTYREQGWIKTKIEEWAPLCKEYLDREQPRVIKICRSAGQDRGQEHTIQQQVSDALGHRVDLTTGSVGSRIAGKSLIHEYLRWKPKPVIKANGNLVYNEEYSLWLMRNRGLDEYKSYLRSFNPDEPEENLPKWQIFNTCPMMIESLKSCSYDKPKKNKVAEDVAEFEGDDPYDNSRYLVDAAERYFVEAEQEFKIIQKQQNIIERLNNTQDFTAFYRNMRSSESNSNDGPKMIPRYSHRH